MCNQVTNTFMWCCCHSVPYICQSIKSRQLCQALNLDCCKYMSSPAAALPQWLGGVKHFLKAQTSHTHTRCFHKRVYVNQFISWHFTGHIKTAEQQTIIQQYGNWYTGRWWVGCYTWHLVQPGGAQKGCDPTQSLPRCTKCNSPTINGHVLRGSDGL